MLATSRQLHSARWTLLTLPALGIQSPVCWKHRYRQAQTRALTTMVTGEELTDTASGGLLRSLYVNSCRAASADADMTEVRNSRSNGSDVDPTRQRGEVHAAKHHPRQCINADGCQTLYYCCPGGGSDKQDRAASAKATDRRQSLIARVARPWDDCVETNP